MSNGPVCHIPPANTPGNPGPLAIPGMPAPAAATVQSLQSVVNQLREIIITILGQQGAQGAAGTNAKPGDFVQKSIKTSTKKIFQNNDPSTGNFVEVQQVQQLVLASKTGGTWTFNAPPANNNG